MIKKLVSHLGEYKRAAVLTPLFAALEAVMDVLLPTIMAFIIDQGIEKGDMNAILKYGLLTFLVAVVALALGVLAGKYAAEASTGFAGNLRDAMYENIQHYSFSNIDKFSTAGLVTRMTTDVTNVQNAYQMLVRMFVRAPIMMISALIMCVKINARISLVFLAALVFLGLVLSFVIRRAFPLFNEMFRGYDSLNASVQENLTGIRVVKAYVREDHENDKFCKATDRLKNLSVHAEKLVIMNQPVMQLTVYTCILLISWIGAKMIVVNGTMTTGELMSLFTYTMQILMSLMMMSMVFVMVSMSVASAERITEVLEEKPELTNPERPVTEVKDGSIVFDHVNFSYKKGSGEYVLKDINLNIHAGETIGIIGGTGSSKSSLVQLIPRLYDVTSGEVKVGGVDVRDYDLETLRDSVAMVLQKNVLFSGTIKENLRWGNEKATDEELIHACKLAQADDFVQTFPHKYDTYIEQGGNNVSGGQKQRLCIARALLKKPKILILDDSTSAVDTKTDAMIRLAFKEYIPDTTKIIIAQRISSVQEADRILVLEGGRIQAVGTHEELLQSCDAYREIAESQLSKEELA